MSKFDYRNNYKYIFNEVGIYGGNQGSPMKNVKAYEYIVRKYHPSFTYEEVENYLIKLDSEGCGYVALINALLSFFVGKENLYQKIFGYSFYDEERQINFNDLIVDFYSATDNHNLVNAIFCKLDYIDQREDESDKKGWGTDVRKREWRFESFLKKYGIKADVRSVKVTPENFEKLSKKGPIIVGIKPEVLYDEQGNQKEQSENGHAMTITGVTGDGRFVVSSWGEKYFIKPGTYEGHENYQQIRFKWIPGSKLGRFYIKHFYRAKTPLFKMIEWAMNLGSR